MSTKRLSQLLICHKAVWTGWIDEYPPSMPGVGGRVGPEFLRAGETFLPLISCRTWKVAPLPDLGNTVELGLKVLLWEIWPQDIKAKLVPPFAHPCSEWTCQVNDGELTLVVKRGESWPADQPWNYPGLESTSNTSVMCWRRDWDCRWGLFCGLGAAGSQWHRRAKQYPGRIPLRASITV